MTALSGKYAAFFRSYGSSVSVSGGGMTQVGSTLEYYVTDRTHRLWDPAYAVTVKDGVTTVTGCIIDYAGGYVTLPATPGGTVTCDFYYKPIESLGGGYQWKLDPKAETKEVTTFSQTLNSAASWREYLALLKGWEGSVSAHWFYGQASLTHGNITFTAVPTGTSGNSVSIELLELAGDNALDVTVSSSKVTVQLETSSGVAQSTEAEVVTAVNTDGDADALLTAAYTGAGTDVVAAKAETSLAGGRDSGEEIAKLGTNIMCEFYLDNTTGSYKILRGVGVLSGVSPNVAIESIVESDLSYQGTGRLRYHTT